MRNTGRKTDGENCFAVTGDKTLCNEATRGLTIYYAQHALAAKL